MIAFFLDIRKKTQGEKNSKLKEKTQNSRKKLNNSSKKFKVSANFVLFFIKNVGEFLKSADFWGFRLEY